MSPSFCVVSVVNEPEHILRRFVGWYLAQGAARVVLYFDDPAHPALPVLAALPRVETVPCTPDFWESLGDSPDTRFTARQNSALTHGYHRATEDWVLVVDADELVWREAGIADLLAAQPADTRSLMITPAEYALTGGDGATFRLPISRRTVNEVYGDHADIFRKRLGLIGHATGKAAHRAGQTDIRLRQHWAVMPDGAAVPYSIAGPAEGAYLLHYLSPDYQSWRAKLDWRLASSGYHAGIHAMVETLRQQEADPEAAYRRLFDVMHRLDPPLVDRLRAAGGLLELPSGFAPPSPR